jgi:hypothetical protein
MGFLGVVTAIIGLALWQSQMPLLAGFLFLVAVIFCILS